MRPLPASFPNVCLQSKLAKGSVVENHGRGLAGIRIEQPIRVGRPIEGQALGYQIRRINPADNIESGFEPARIRPSRQFIAANAAHEHALDGEGAQVERSEEHTSELQSLMRISYAVFCLKKKK